MRFRHRRRGLPFLAALGFCLALTGICRASRTMDVSTTRPRIVDIEVASLLDEPPQRGYAPLRITVRNLSDRDGEWRFRFDATADYNERRRMESVFSMAVEANSLKTVQWNVPVYPSTHGGTSRYAQLQLEVSGPGVAGNRQTLLSSNSYRSGGDIVTLGMTESLARKHREAVQQHINAHHDPMLLSTLDMELMPASAEGLSGLDVILMGRDEWESRAVNRDVFNRWMALGGHLVLVGGGERGRERVGLGGVIGLTPDRLENVEREFFPFIRGLETPQERLIDGNAYLAGQWDLRRALEDISRPFGLFMVVVIVIAALLGPVNLWLGFRRRRIMQLIWTTPAISLALSLLVGLGIVIGDGFGGRGERSLLVLLLPEENLEVKLQEQVSRTGVLLNGGFTLPEDARIYPVRVETGRSDAGGEMIERPDGFRAGDWFANRRIQGQVLEQARSSRARVEFIPGGDGEAPRLVSTVNASFLEVMVRDASGRYWAASRVAPGTETVLNSIDASVARNRLEEWRTRRAGPFPIGGNDGERGWFSAVAEAAPDAYLDTLDSIDWNDRPVIYTGPVVERGRP